MGGLTGVRYMTQPTSQRQQPRYNQRVPRNPQANAGQRTAGSERGVQIQAWNTVPQSIPPDRPVYRGGSSVSE